MQYNPNQSEVIAAFFEKLRNNPARIQFEKSMFLPLDHTTFLYDYNERKNFMLLITFSLKLS